MNGKTTQSVHCTITGSCLRMRHRPSACQCTDCVIMPDEHRGMSTLVLESFKVRRFFLVGGKSTVCTLCGILVWTLHRANNEMTEFDVPLARSFRR